MGHVSASLALLPTGYWLGHLAGFPIGLVAEELTCAAAPMPYDDGGGGGGDDDSHDEKASNMSGRSSNSSHPALEPV
jgi:hypothetical protein